MMLAVTGIFGLANYTVSRRMRELGISVALGAQNRQVLRTALGRVGWLLSLGSCAGLLLGIGASKLLTSIVYQATAADPLVLFMVALTMAILGLVSAAIPARRACTSIRPSSSETNKQCSSLRYARSHHGAVRTKTTDPQWSMEPAGDQANKLTEQNSPTNRLPALHIKIGKEEAPESHRASSQKRSIDS